MQHVELAEGNPARADLLHRALIFAAPGIRKREPIKRKPKWLENALGFARNPCAPVDERSENIKKQRSCGHLRHCRLDRQSIFFVRTFSDLMDLQVKPKVKPAGGCSGSRVTNLAPPRLCGLRPRRFRYAGALLESRFE